MNIGVIHGFVGGGGGTEKTLHAILSALEESRHSVTLYTFSKPNLKPNKIKIKTILPISFPSFGLYQRAMESKLISKAQNEDILIQASGGLGIPEVQNQKLIVYCHSDFSNELDNPSTKYKGLLSIYYKSYYNMIKKFTHNIHDPRIYLLSNSQFIHDSLKSRFNKESEIVYPPVDLSEFNPLKKQTHVITIGRFSEEKNLAFGIKIMSKTNIPYTIIGNTKTKSNILYYEKLESKINRMKIKMSVNLLKNIPREELVQKLNTSKLYLHCSKETFGISVIESIAAGCIPVVPDNSAHRETVPFEELRYKEDDVMDAQNKIEQAIRGDFDFLLPKLHMHVQKFSKENFQKSIMQLIERIS